MSEHEPTPPAGDFQQRVIDEFRANGGVVGGPLRGSHLLLLTTVGAQTHRRHTTPLGYLDVDGTRLVVASAAGGESDPAWLHNLRTHPVATVEVGTDSYPALASVLPGPDRERLWDEVVRREPGYDDHQRSAARILPLVELRPLRAAGEVERARGLGNFLQEVHRWLADELDQVLAHVDLWLADPDADTGTGAGTGADTDAGTPEPVPPTLPPRSLLAQVRERCLTFCGALEGHHQGEDHRAFPMLEQGFPALGPVLQQLRVEHEVVTETNARIRDLIESYTPGSDDPRELRATLQGLVERLQEHFAYEEVTIVEALDALADAPPA